MKKLRLYDALVTGVILLLDFGISMLLQLVFETQAMSSMIFVLGVFLVAYQTQGYFWGITASLGGVLAVNYAFTYPYYAFDLWSPECVSAAVCMLIVAILTGTLTTKLKHQEKVKMEAERERMRSNLLRAVSHDLRTPLTSIYGVCTTVIEGYDTLPRDRKLKLLTDARSDAKWLVRMVENLLSVTRIDQSSVSLHLADTVLEELIDTVLVKFRKHYPQQEIIVEIPEEFVIIPMDALLIEQVLMNLLENSLFHARGMEHLWLTVQRRGDLAEFQVADDGCGIPPERLPGLFTGGMSPEAPSDTGRSNMGIGLTVCSAIVKAHGGEIRGENREEGGAEFTFYLKIKEDDHGE